MSAQPSAKKPEFEVCEAIADNFRRANLGAEPIGHHPQIAPQLYLAVPEMVSNFAAFECRDKGIGNPAPGYCLPIL